jgi:phosphopantothenoylcysteine decarboxylase / phosphopantothenate---cysteine ligase
LADDLASTALLATDKPVLIAPAMNVRMWQHPATQRNLAALQADGIGVVGPNDGEMACGEFGPGRMAEPAEIVTAVIAALTPKAQPLANRKVLITAGPTREPIDPVRFISNHSSGKQGYAIAAAAASLGAETVLVSGPVSLPQPRGVRVVHVETASDMLKACEAELPADIAIFSAAVADWRVSEVAGDKLKKGAAGPPSLSLAENPDILRTVAGMGPKRPQLVVGFAAETQDVLANARAKLGSKGCDLIVANDVSASAGVFGGDRNTVHLISSSGTENWPGMSKQDVAEKLMGRLTALLGERDRKAAE